MGIQAERTILSSLGSDWTELAISDPRESSKLLLLALKLTPGSTDIAHGSDLHPDSQLRMAQNDHSSGRVRMITSFKPLISSITL